MDENTCLEFIFSNVNRWVEHAEKKNVFVFSTFSLISFLSGIVTNQSSIFTWIKIGSVITIVIYLIPLFFTLRSLFPMTRFSKLVLEKGKDKKSQTDDNLLFFGDIIKYSTDEYLQTISKKYSLKLKKGGIHNDLIKQIIINSHIANRKYQYFKISSVLLFIAVLQFVILFSISLFI